MFRRILFFISWITFFMISGIVVAVVLHEVSGQSGPPRTAGIVGSLVGAVVGLCAWQKFGRRNKRD